MVLLDAFLVHPSAGVEGFEDVGVDAFAGIVIPYPHRCGPYACIEVHGFVEVLVASVLAVVRHLDVIAVEVVGVRTIEKLLSFAFASIAKKQHRFALVPCPDYHRRIVSCGIQDSSLPESSCSARQFV